MRSYALFLALAVLHARAATIPAPETEKKIPIEHGALDDVSLDNNESEQELVSPADTVKDVENNLRNSIPENVPVEIIEEQPIIKSVPLKEDSNDYVPDNDDSSNIKRVEIDLKNPGPPQRQEHDSQKPVTYHSYIDKERAVAAIKQTIAESQNIFTRGIQDVNQKFKYYFANNAELDEVSKNIQSLRHNFDAQVVKLSKTINSYLKPEHQTEDTQNVEIPPNIKEVENSLKSLETNFNYGVGMLSEGVELLSILKAEDEQNLKIAGKADNENTATVTQVSSTGPATASPTNPSGSNIVAGFVQNLNDTMVGILNNLGDVIQNFFSFNQNTNQNQSSNTTNPGGFNPSNLFQGVSFPNIFQQNTNQNAQQGTPAAGAQSDDPGSTQRPNILQQIQTSIQNFVNPQQGAQQVTQPPSNPIAQIIANFSEGIGNFFQGPQQASTVNTPPAADVPVAQGTNTVPAAPAQVEPIQPTKQPEKVENAPAQAAPIQPATAQSGPIQQIVQNNPIVKGITGAVQRIQGLSNPTKPRDAVVENSDSKGHGDHNGGSVSGVDDTKKAPEKEQPEKIPEIQDSGEPSGELNKTE